MVDVGHHRDFLSSTPHALQRAHSFYNAAVKTVSKFHTPE